MDQVPGDSAYCLRGRRLPDLTGKAKLNMTKSDETAANDAIRISLQALQRARELSERARYGAQILHPLDEALREAQHALDTALGRN